VLVGIGDGVAHARGLVFILRLVGLEQCDVALDLGVGGVHVAEDLAAWLAGLLALLNIDQRALLLALIVVEDAQGNADAQAERLDAVGLLFDEL